MSTVKKLSAVIITYNEVNYIKDCIESVLFADEIIVVDSFSTDGTWEYLESHPKVTAIQHPFEDFTKQKSYALSLAKNDWVLFIDADEIITKELQSEIQTVLKNPSKEAYYIYRSFIMLGTPLRFSGFQTDKVYRLFNKMYVKFNPEKTVHEDLIVKGSSGGLNEKLEHHFFKSYKDYKRRMLLYGTYKGKELYKAKLNPNFYHLNIKPAYKFLTHYIIRLGFLDGKNGFIISKLNALSVKERYLEIKRLKKLNS
ncbi:glycosyltransferase family 2 protein [Joostella sp.]|uniref:glycosyltransferase family 2 protein n=1 Tax=Joostella sp. TaxID=2231138 RepID=UPI003A95896D